MSYLLLYIQVWQIVKGKLECAEVIKTKDSIRKLEAYGNMIFVITKGHKMKVDMYHSSCNKRAETITQYYHILISTSKNNTHEANNLLQLLDSSRISQSIFKGKGVKSMVASQGKIYIGCIDTSIQVCMAIYPCLSSK